jgi:hypothetical protein
LTSGLGGVIVVVQSISSEATMSHSHSNYIRPRGFRTYCVNQYYANRDEYDGFQQVQPHSFEEYVAANLGHLRRGYRPLVAEKIAKMNLKG